MTRIRQHRLLRLSDFFIPWMKHFGLIRSAAAANQGLSAASPLRLAMGNRSPIIPWLLEVVFPRSRCPSATWHRDLYVPAQDPSGLAGAYEGHLSAENACRSGTSDPWKQRCGSACRRRNLPVGCSVCIEQKEAGRASVRTSNPWQSAKVLGVSRHGTFTKAECSVWNT